MGLSTDKLQPASLDLSTASGTQGEFTVMPSHGDDQFLQIPSPTMDTERVLESERIQSLRGLACVLLVSFHVIGQDATHGLNVAADSALRLFADLLAPIRMPLFTFISGFVYAYRPVIPGSGATFWSRKIRRLAVPLAVATTIYYLAHAMAPGSHEMVAQPIWRVYLFPYAHLWFLQAIIVLFSIVALLDHAGLMRTLRQYGVILGLAIGLQLVLHVDRAFFSVNHAIYLAPFFLLGIGANRFRSIFQQSGSEIVAIGIFVVAMGAAVASVLRGTPMPQPQTLWATVLSMSSCLALLTVMPRVPSLGIIGTHSYAIYLYHLMFVAAVNHLGHAVGVTNVGAHLLFGITAGIVGPMLFATSLDGFPRVRRLILGS
jgi:surface polysaccharide O-acyltransferase-like enzyme